MKKYLLLLFLLLPALTFAQSQNDSSGFVGVIFGIVLFIVIFFVFRRILLWYSKADLAKKQEEINKERSSSFKPSESKDAE